MFIHEDRRSLIVSVGGKRKTFFRLKVSSSFGLSTLLRSCLLGGAVVQIQSDLGDLIIDHFEGFYQVIIFFFYSLIFH